MKSVLVVCAATVMATSAMAANRAPQNAAPVLRESSLDISTTSYPWMSSTEFKEAVKTAHDRGNRKVASSGIDYESQMSDNLKEIRAKILAVKSPAQIDSLINEYQAKFDTLAPDAKMLMAQLVLLQPFKGIVYRIAPLAAKTNVTHSVMLSFVMRQAAQMKVYFPTEQANALFAYLTQPYDGVVQFKEGEEFQAFLGDVVYPAALKSAETIKGIPVSTPLVWDNKILYAGIVDANIDTQDRYTLIGSAEKWALLAAKQMGLHYLTAFRSYSVKNVMAMSKEMGSLYGVDGFTTSLLPNGSVDGVNSLERTAVFKKPKYAGTFILYRDGRLWMERSFNHMKEAVSYLRIAWEEVKDKPAAENFLLNPAFFVGFDRQINNHLSVLEEMVQGPTKIRSRLTGETMVVDLKGFYMNPPNDVKSLLPTSFDMTQKFSKTQIKVGKSAKAEDVSYYNYFHGRPTDWNVNAYKTIFPEIKKGSDVSTAARVLAQSWGGVVLAGPLRAVVR
ncbi:hypothetical protein [Bdellovibrio sp. NC01]|uniref:hypothetical protein n=1 Tax=Bdellovibrio sp. NC01 TaxID=2220073 RepID=UPI0011575EA7|nr:hypothetical protein [Bdellovibrio sp. NC01]